MSIDNLIRKLQSERLHHGNIEVVLDGDPILDVATFHTIPKGALATPAVNQVWLSIHEAE